MIRYILATLYLAIGLAVALTIVPTAIFMAGLAGKSDGISFSSSDGVHVMRFHSDPGNLIFIAHGSTPGDKVLDFVTEGNQGGTHFEWKNPWFELFVYFAFIFVSMPLVKRILLPRKKIEPCVPANPSQL